ncbi:2-phospho-L-lactate guanylyltransferase [Halorientalis sp. IM1011]|uniref:2-phospho-L-lactate guanylyltransferase n=1 Tax=Halorientalis sp. IM1011 TaxID=1932360 RepID=UPI00097CCC55|nr:2-phospho-L-lactate guanylyltransferase [Halorientalis sp. IM1011]AQL43378.1 2-phospho-L-lactate guanylyltransferase [Halorientalis sp. IM1011]
MDVLVPLAVDEPKTRLAGTLASSERADFARTMCADVLDAIRESRHSPEVLATAAVDVDAPVRIDARPLTEAVNAALAEAFSDGADAVGVVMADLALATPAALDRLFEADGDVVLAPGRGGGTNAIVVRHPEFRTDYHGASIRDHRAAARAVDADVTEIDSVRLATDVDEPEDLVEVLLHGEGRAREWLVEAGFEITTADGRATVTRAQE